MEERKVAVVERWPFQICSGEVLILTQILSAAYNVFIDPVEKLYGKQSGLRS